MKTTVFARLKDIFTCEIHTASGKLCELSLDMD